MPPKRKEKSINLNTETIQNDSSKTGNSSVRSSEISSSKSAVVPTVTVTPRSRGYLVSGVSSAPVILNNIGKQRTGRSKA